jgi:hypothetical protein
LGDREPQWCGGYLTKRDIDGRNEANNGSRPFD